MNPLYGGYGWVGRLSDFFQGLLDTARSWLADDHPAVRLWAEEFVISLEHEIVKARERDDEDEVRW